MDVGRSRRTRGAAVGSEGIEGVTAMGPAEGTARREPWIEVAFE